MTSRAPADPAWLRPAIAAMACIAAAWLGYEFWRLLFQDGAGAAIDLKQRQIEVQRWFNREPIYRETKSAVYPPASYLMLWPFFGWTSVGAARWIWAITAIPALWMLARATIAGGGSSSPTQKLFLGLVPLSMYATGATLGNGQLLVHMMPLLLASVVALQQPTSFRRDATVAATMTLALVKPTVSAPFFWLVVFVPGTLRPAILTVAAYVALTLISSAFQPDNPFELFYAWGDKARGASEWSASAGGVANQQTWLETTLPGFTTSFAVLILLVLGAWIAWQRGKDLWLLMGVTALTARFWAYHSWYDDLLLLVPMITLFRLAGGSPHGTASPWAGLLLVLVLASTLAPGGHYALPQPWSGLYTIGQAVLWAAVLVYLLVRTGRSAPVERVSTTGA